ncbi:MAG: hypothetical protein GY804_10580 [Alphaproteobacteria bacterium]|nr:hypothetical protein [Alphaproteobacteria bacterium]
MALENMKIRTKFTVLISLAVLCMLSIVGIGNYGYQNMGDEIFEQKKLRVRTTVLTTHKMLDSLMSQPEAYKMPKEQLQKKIDSIVKASRHTRGDLTWIIDLKGKLVAFPYISQYDTSHTIDAMNTPGFFKKHIAKINQMKKLKVSEQGYLKELWPNHNNSETEAKVIFVKRFENWIIGAAINEGEVIKISLEIERLRLGLLASTFILISVFFSNIMANSISNPLAAIRSNMERLTKDDNKNITIYGTTLGNEIGDMARSLEVLKQYAFDAKRLNLTQMLANELNGKNTELEKALKELEETKDYMILQEKMAALGGLVAGVAHEINTPVGIVVSTSSHLEEQVISTIEKYKEGKLNKTELSNFFTTSKEATELLMVNSKRAAELINSFKLVAVDQTSDEKRKFNLAEYLEEIVTSLRPTLKKIPHTVDINCPDNIIVDGYPGALSQIISNFIMNSIIHGFDEVKKPGKMLITAEFEDLEKVKIIYEDTGKGIDEENLQKIFNPFFTTKRGAGGSGLGLNIVYNIITKTLGGKVFVSSKVGVGTRFELVFPMDMPYAE